MSEIDNAKTALRFYWNELKRKDLQQDRREQYYKVSGKIVEYLIEFHTREYYDFLTEYMSEKHEV